MNKTQKAQLCVKLLAQEAEKNEKQPSTRLTTFFQKEAFKNDEKCLPATTKVPGHEPGSFRLVVAPPSWDVASMFGGLDDAIVGEGGEWTHAHDYVPIFQAANGAHIVARITDEKCAVGWFEEGSFQKNDGGFSNGVFPLADSLDAFLKTLVSLDEADRETESDDDMWEDVESDLSEEDDDDEEDDEDEE